MTTDELQQECCTLMAAKRAMIDSLNVFEPMVMMHWPEAVMSKHPIIASGSWARLPGLERMGPLLESGEAIGRLCDAFRDLIRESGADGFIFCCEAWRGKATPEGMWHAAEIEANVDKDLEKLVRMGWVMREEVIKITGQTAQDVVTVSHAFRHKKTHVEWDAGGRDCTAGHVRRQA